MADPNVREIDGVDDLDGVRLVVGVDYDTVTIGHPGAVKWRLPLETAEEFAQLFTQACWEAAADDD